MPTVMGPGALASELTSLLDHAITCVFNCTSPYKSIQPKGHRHQCFPTSSSPLAPPQETPPRYAGPFYLHSPVLRHTLKEKQPVWCLDPAVSRGGAPRNSLDSFLNPLQTQSKHYSFYSVC